MSITQFHDNFSFVRAEEKILKFWEENGVELESEKVRDKGIPFCFTEGPISCSSLKGLHFGHLLQSYTKDTMIKYKSLTGHTIEKTFGWDMGGIPVSSKVAEILRLKNNEDIELYGIDKFNEQCLQYALGCINIYMPQIKRIGRWIGLRQYGTMDQTFIESIWWSFKTMYDKGYIYKGIKIIPYSTKCECVLSKSESTQNYKKVSDPSLYVKFKTKENEYILIWTSTPWSLPSNMAIAVHPEMIYCRIEDNDTNEIYIVGKDILDNLYKLTKKEKKDKVKRYRIINEFQGKTLSGLSYEPPFKLYKKKVSKKAFHIVTADYVDNKSGTMCVHMAPAYGAEDLKTCIEYRVIGKDGKGYIDPIDNEGKFKIKFVDEIYYNKNGKRRIKYAKYLYFKDADKYIIKYLSKKKLVFRSETFDHEYPFCYRTNTPLIYKAQESYFVNMDMLRDRIIENNVDTKFVPAIMGDRFINYIKNSIDWSISRTKYWGTPLPIWEYRDEMIVIGSISELEHLTGLKVGGLYRQYVDKLKIPSKKYPGEFLTRTNYVMDVWWESAAAPFAQYNYPFAMGSHSQIEKMLPISFLTEATEQIQLWFYNLSILATAIFDKPAFKNVICSGMIVDQDGKRFQKKLNNYPDPSIAINEHGSDALRIFLLNSQLLIGQTKKFSNDDIRLITKSYFLKWFNATKFFLESYKIMKDKDQKFNIDMNLVSDNDFDIWILSILKTTINKVIDEMDKYYIYKAIPEALSFIDLLTNWYIKLNRDRIKGFKGDDNCVKSLTTLYKALYCYTILMSPFTPFLCETLYQKLNPISVSRKKSVHYQLLSDVEEILYDCKINKEIENRMATMIQSINQVRMLRSSKGISLRKPLRHIILATDSKVNKDNIMKMKDYILGEVNALNLEVNDAKVYINHKMIPNMKNIGKIFKKDSRKITQLLSEIDDVSPYVNEETFMIGEFELNREYVDIIPEKRWCPDGYEILLDNHLVILIDPTQNEFTDELYHARTLGNQIQQLRKRAGLHVWNKIRIFHKLKMLGASEIATRLNDSSSDKPEISNDEYIYKIIEKHKDYIKNIIGYDIEKYTEDITSELIIGEELDVNDKHVTILLFHP